MSDVPNYDQLMTPLFQALKELGGSGSITELEDKVAELLALPESVVEIPHNPEKSNQTEFGYRLAWARTYLKKSGLIENSTRGVWSIASDKRQIDSIDPQVIVRTVRDADRARRATEPDDGTDTDDNGDVPDEARSWREQLHYVLTNKVDPAAFERLVQRLLRESGFVHVEVTGKSGDGGIDGKGIARVSGMLSFHVIFQCKRYQGSVTASHVRDFRGAMVGRADKGLLITTGNFTRDAIREATRDGAPPIDLMDGDQLADKLRELSLGIKTEVVERITIDQEWYTTL